MNSIIEEKYDHWKKKDTKGPSTIINKDYVRWTWNLESLYLRFTYFRVHTLTEVEGLSSSNEL